MSLADKTPAYRLFHKRYIFMVPRVFLYGHKYLDRVGTASTGDAALDIQRQSVTEPMKKTVAAIAMFHDMGAPIALVDRKDAPAIYRDIQDHLRNWEYAIAEGIYYKEVPDISEFRALEAVAIAVYPTVMRQRPSEEKENRLTRRLSEMRARRGPLMVRPLEEPKEKMKPYQSIVDNIERMLAEAQPWL